MTRPSKHSTQWRGLPVFLGRACTGVFKEIRAGAVAAVRHCRILTAFKQSRAPGKESLQESGYRVLTAGRSCAARQAAEQATVNFRALCRVSSRALACCRRGGCDINCEELARTYSSGKEKVKLLPGTGNSPDAGQRLLPSVLHSV